MRVSGVIGCGFLVLPALWAAVIPAGDSRRGEELFRNENCVQCHAINGQGGTVGPDLGKRIDRNFTPALLASTMWNHAPAMWAAMRKQGVVKSALSPESAADLFAYFYSTRFFDKPGDAARGKALFASRHCVECHGGSGSEGAKPAAQWEAVGHPVALVDAMWNHASSMRDAFARKNIAIPQLSSQDLSDILVYVRNLPENRSRPAAFHYEVAPGGEQAFQAHGCRHCHGMGSNTLEGRLGNATLTDIAAALWNHHGPKEAAIIKPISEEDMRKLLGYVWVRQFFSAQGDAGRGKRVFTGKGCAACHNDPSSGAPSLASRKGTFSDITMVSVLWEHGPRMLERMQERKIAWPRFEAGQMSDLIAYLNSIE